MLSTLHEKSHHGESLGEILSRNFPQNKMTLRILAIGCGFSKIPEEMALEGYGHVTCVDQRQEAKAFIENEWRKKGFRENRLAYKVGNIFEEIKSFESNSFDAVLDKGNRFHEWK